MSTRARSLLCRPGLRGRPGAGHRLAAVALALIGLTATTATPADESARHRLPEPVRIGLDADLSKSSALGGEAIRRGAELAIAELNARGGVLGRPLELVARDNRRNPARGADNVAELARMPDLVAVIGGMSTPVAVAVAPVAQHDRLVYLVPWAPGEAVLGHSTGPGYVFRLGPNDADTGALLVHSALARGHRRPGLALWRTARGRALESTIQVRLGELGLPRAPVAWLDTDQSDMAESVDNLLTAGADLILVAAGPRESGALVREVARRPSLMRLPIISDSSLTGGSFHDEHGELLDRVELSFLQTYSFLSSRHPERAREVVEAYCERFRVCRAEAIPAPMGTAHAYDLVHLLARAITAAGSVDRPRVRDALERIEVHHGLVRDYLRPFSAMDHEALGEDDHRLFAFSANGAVVPVDRRDGARRPARVPGV
ncbi:MAG: ABC transporter substrate-binding protein [Ectothiorhodospiraceae bacterium]|nr:ABC transporter substrate-binding protein [Ectothiorhodospiraceae bacterium]